MNAEVGQQEAMPVRQVRASMIEVVPQLLTESQTAKYLSVSRQFLRKSRMNGNRKGHAPAPPFIRFGRSIRYRIDDLQR
jgi:hypothetical protein